MARSELEKASEILRYAEQAIISDGPILCPLCASRSLQPVEGRYSVIVLCGGNCRFRVEVLKQ